MDKDNHNEDVLKNLLDTGSSIEFTGKIKILPKRKTMTFSANKKKMKQTEEQGHTVHSRDFLKDQSILTKNDTSDITNISNLSVASADRIIEEMENKKTDVAYFDQEPLEYFEHNIPDNVASSMKPILSIDNIPHIESNDKTFNTNDDVIDEETLSSAKAESERTLEEANDKSASATELIEEAKYKSAITKKLHKDVLIKSATTSDVLDDIDVDDLTNKELVEEAVQKTATSKKLYEEAADISDQSKKLFDEATQKSETSKQLLEKAAGLSETSRKLLEEVKAEPESQQNIFEVQSEKCPQRTCCTCKKHVAPQESKGVEVSADAFKLEDKIVEKEPIVVENNSKHHEGRTHKVRTRDIREEEKPKPLIKEEKDDVPVAETKSVGVVSSAYNEGISTFIRKEDYDKNDSKPLIGTNYEHYMISPLEPPESSIIPEESDSNHLSSTPKGSRH